MWRALLRVTLLHLDAAKNAPYPGAPESELEPVPKTRAVNISSGNKAMSGLVPSSAPRTVPTRHSKTASVYAGVSKTRPNAEVVALRQTGKHSSDAACTDAGEGMTMVVSLPLVMETCGYLLPLWGYR